jgi:hypothetical protein
MNTYKYILIFTLIYCNSISQTIINYDTDIQPIFDNSCMPCHSGTNPAGGLNLTSYDDVMNGGNSGDVINIGSYESSTLWQEVSSGDMPNNVANNNMGIPDLTTEEIQLIENWILDLQCTVILCEPNYTCVLGECVCINDEDDDGICDEDEVNIEEIDVDNQIIKQYNLSGQQINSQLEKGVKINIYKNGTTQKVHHIN